jgi:hypothetical protein
MLTNCGSTETRDILHLIADVIARSCVGIIRVKSTQASSYTHSADVAQLVEHVLGKDEVTGSIPVVGSGCVEKIVKYSYIKLSPK